MNVPYWKRCLLLLHTLILISFSAAANENLYQQARTLQREDKYNEAIEAFKNFLTQPQDDEVLNRQERTLYIEALIQLMNTYQSKGEPETCITTLQDIYKVSPVLHKDFSRDYYSVLGYALSRTENMKKAKETILKALALPLHQPTPERIGLWR